MELGNYFSASPRLKKSEIFDVPSKPRLNICQHGFFVVRCLGLLALLLILISMNKKSPMTSFNWVAFMWFRPSPGSDVATCLPAKWLLTAKFLCVIAQSEINEVGKLLLRKIVLRAGSVNKD